MQQHTIYTVYSRPI